MNLLLHPAYFPSIGTFGAMMQYPATWEVHDNYQKQTFRNRCHICTDQGRHLLTIPVKHVGGKQGRQLYRDVRVDNDSQWQRTHWRSLQTAYRTSPFFEYYEEDLASLFEQPPEFLLDHNLKTTECICRCLGMDMPRLHTNHYEQAVSGIADLRYLINAKRPLDWPQEEYIQVFGERHGFVPNASILDLLFNIGTGALQYLGRLELPWPDV